MADEEPREVDPVDEDEVTWLEDADGTEYFLDDDGVRWELAEDGYAYAVEDEDAIEDEDAWAEEVIVIEDEDAWAEDPDTTTVLPTVSTHPREEPRTTVLPPAGADDLLVLEDVRSGYGKLPVLHGVGFRVPRGQTAVLLGLNGAGKTTTAMNVCGAVDTWGGRISFDGQDATRWSTRQAVGNGIVMVPEGRRVFPDLTVEKNLQVGAWSQRHDDDWFAEQRDQVFGYFPRLRDRRTQLAGTLSGGEQQMLAIGRGLMAGPRLLIIDEASMGLAPVIVHDVFEIVSQINDDGVTVFMIESNVGVLEVADLALVMEQGHIIRQLEGEELRDRAVVTEILMG